MYRAASVSSLFNTRKVSTTRMISSDMGLMMGASSPAPKAAARKVLLRSGRAGRPKDTLLTPSTVPSPKRLLTSLMAFKVSRTWSCWADAVSTRQSMRTSSLGIP